MLSQIPSVYKHFDNENGPLRGGTFRHWKNGRSRNGSLSTSKRWLQRLGSEGEVVSHNVGRPRGGWCVSCFRLFSAHTSRIVCDLCVCSVDPMIDSGAWSCQDAYCGHDCRHTMLYSRQCSQTSAGIWHRARPQQRPGEKKRKLNTKRSQREDVPPPSTPYFFNWLKLCKLVCF